MRKMRKKRKRKKRAITNYSSVSGTPTSGLIISGTQPEVFLKSIPPYPIKQNLSKSIQQVIDFPRRFGYSSFQKPDYSSVSGFCIPTSGITESVCKIDPLITSDKATFKPNQF